MNFYALLVVRSNNGHFYLTKFILMKATLDTIFLVLIIANEGLKNKSYEETIQYIRNHFEHTEFENEFIKEQFKNLAYSVARLRSNYEYLK